MCDDSPDAMAERVVQLEAELKAEKKAVNMRPPTESECFWLQKAAALFDIGHPRWSHSA